MIYCSNCGLPDSPDHICPPSSLRRTFGFLARHPVVTGALGGFFALVGQGGFNKVFDGVYAMVTERVQFPMTLRQIEYYRSLADKCSPQVRNTIEALNARIEYEHEANRQWFLVDWASTDRWNQVESIQMDCDRLQVKR